MDLLRGAILAGILAALPAWTQGGFVMEGGTARLLALDPPPPFDPCMVAGQSLATASESAVKAAYLLRFADYVEWPEPPGSGPLVVAVLGEDPFGEILAQAARARSQKGYPTLVMKVKDPLRLPKVHVLYSGSHEGAHWQEVQALLRGRGVLTVGEAGAAPWAAVVFVSVQDRVRFRANPAAAEAAGVKLGSRLLSLSWKEGS